MGFETYQVPPTRHFHSGIDEIGIDAGEETEKSRSKGKGEVRVGRSPDMIRGRGGEGAMDDEDVVGEGGRPHGVSRKFSR